MGHRASLWQGLVLPLSFLCPQSPPNASVMERCLCPPPTLCSPGDRLRFYQLTMLTHGHNPAEPWCPSHIRAWKGWPVPTVEWTEGSVQTPLPHRRTPLTHRLPLSHPDLGNDTAPDSKSMMELSNVQFPTPVKTQYRPGTH